MEQLRAKCKLTFHVLWAKINDIISNQSNENEAVVINRLNLYIPQLPLSASLDLQLLLEYPQAQEYEYKHSQSALHSHRCGNWNVMPS